MGPKARLGDLERAVMDQLWKGDDREQWATVREVYDALAATRDLAYTTVMTVLQRLARKGLVEEQRAGRAYLYRAAASRSDLTAELIHDVLADAEAADRRSALVRFVDSASEADLDTLRDALERLGRR
jgi:predicted transcriptional regulator